MNTKSVSKFVLLSLIGVFLFFVPVQNSKVPVVLITDTIKALLGPALGLVVVISCTLLVLGLIGARVFHIKALEQYYSGDPVIKMGFFLASAILVWMVTLNVDLPFIQHPEIGGKILTLASTVFFTIALAGTEHSGSQCVLYQPERWYAGDLHYPFGYRGVCIGAV